MSNGADCIIICEGANASPTIRNLAEHNGMIIMVTSYDAYTAARLINQSIPIDFCKGELNFSLYNVVLENLRHKHDIQLSSVEDYNAINERNKFLWADLIIFQFPIYWFNVPGKLKLYMEVPTFDHRFAP